MGSALKLHEPNRVASSWSTGLQPPGSTAVESASASSGCGAHVREHAVHEPREDPRPGTPQIVTRRHGPWPSALENERAAVLRLHASQ